ncbi:hypothetical protein LSAT2_019064 [Lamellibrachia satsuma]|nr:hypothetical protein LSAT2_019064 [Lamellibrachia satsuma]
MFIDIWSKSTFNIRLSSFEGAQLSVRIDDLFIYLAVCANPSALYKTNIIQPTISLNSSLRRSVLLDPLDTLVVFKFRNTRTYIIHRKDKDNTDAQSAVSKSDEIQYVYSSTVFMVSSF